MIDLLLSDATGGNGGSEKFVEKRKALLNELESHLWSLMTAGGRSEIRLWLCNTIACIRSIFPIHQCELFMKLLKTSRQKRRLAAQLLELLFEKQPQKVGPIVAKKSFMLEKFFKGNSKRILAWFSNFAGPSGVEHKKGAKALSQFAFKNRDVCWEELEWRGKHGQSPAMVATKPHYFLDLDVEKTVENFLEYVPNFWASTEFSESLKDGEIVHVDKEFFVEMFLNLMYKEDMEELWDIIDEFLTGESFSFLCHHLLIVLEEQDLLYFLNTIHKFLKPSLEVTALGNPSFWLEVVLSKCSIVSVDQLFLLNAVTSQARQLLRLVREEADENEKEEVKSIVTQVCSSSGPADNLAPIMDEWPKNRNLESIKWLGLQSWAIFYRLSEGFHTSESWESLFASNGIGFRKSHKYDLIDLVEDSEDGGFEWEERSLDKVKRRKKERRSTKRRRKLKSKQSLDALLDFDFPDNTGSWLLSTDQFSATWSAVDLPEHISKHCFSTWIKLSSKEARDT
ncbi:OLC1v1013548C1 [Oldenlandia corymbosa var. corymbosa]|uniref:OLC1v1013548C1 n=1 Tax=Oldenlandia corymbosa var. corymbosa TaxID=529605 RepID=A0AAV1DYP8_OLDCO|nr:OLC1v1013548C1 [Oldenlandia corymbosa var. corymbosa]